MQDVVVVNLCQGVPSTFVDRAFAQLDGFGSISERGLLWSHAVPTHGDADAALDAWIDVSGQGSLFDVFRQAGYHTICIGAREGTSRNAETMCAHRGGGPSMDVHDASAAYQALRFLLDPHERPLFVMICLHGCADVTVADKVLKATRAFSVEGESSCLAPSVYGDDMRNDVSGAGAFAPLVATLEGESDDVAALSAGEHAARLHTVAWDALVRADEIIRVLRRALTVTEASKTILAATATCSLALREHGLVGCGGHWTACNRSFFAIHTGCEPMQERRPVSMSVFSHVLLDISGIPQGGTVSLAWNPPEGVAVTVHTVQRVVETPCFVRCILSHHGRVFAWTVWFGDSIARDFRSQFSALDMLYSQHVVRHAVYDVSSDPDEMVELWSDSSWYQTPLSKVLWERVRKHVVSLPELSLRAFRDLPPPPPALSEPRVPQALLRARTARTVEAGTSDRRHTRGPPPVRDQEGAIRTDGLRAEVPIVRDSSHVPSIASFASRRVREASSRVVVPPTEDLLPSGTKGDDDGDSWCSGPASAVELNSRTRHTTSTSDDATIRSMSPPRAKVRRDKPAAARDAMPQTRRPPKNFGGRPR